MTHTWWYLARSSGFVAWGLCAAAVLWGLLLSTRVFDRWPSPKWLTDLHRFLGGLAVVFTGLHVAMLVADNYVHFGVKEVLVPFASQWRSVPVAWGVISMWLLAAIEGTSLLMKYLPRRVWHGIHMSSFVLFFTATLHALTAGTDRHDRTFATVCTAVLAMVMLLTLVRLAVPRTRGARARPAPARASPAASEVATATEKVDSPEERLAFSARASRQDS